MREFIKVKASNLSLSLRSPVFGVGVNDAWYTTSTKENGKTIRCPVYRKWNSMLMRCYSEKYLEKHKSYKGCSVCKEWLTFSNFERWFSANSVKGYQLDKDIIKKGNKEYSPDMCIFVPSCINLLLIYSEAARGDLPVGVFFCEKSRKYKAQCSVDGIQKSAGYFNDPNDAHKAYIVAKNTEIKRKCKQYPELEKYLTAYIS